MSAVISSVAKMRLLSGFVMSNTLDSMQLLRESMAETVHLHSRLLVACAAACGEAISALNTCFRVCECCTHARVTCVAQSLLPSTEWSVGWHAVIIRSCSAVFVRETWWTHNLTTSFPKASLCELQTDAAQHHDTSATGHCTGLA